MRLVKMYADGCRDIGEFLFEFSQLEFSIRVLLHARIRLAEEYFDLVISPYDFAALCNVSREVLLKQLPAKAATIKDVFAQCLALNENRVRIAHGLWTYGADSLVARVVSRGSLQMKYYFEKSGELRELAQKAQMLNQAVLTIGR